MKSVQIQGQGQNSYKVPLPLLLRYVMVGGGCATVELVLFQILHRFANLPIMFSNVLAVSFVTIVGFLGQKIFTFRNRGRTLEQGSMYLLMLLIGFVLNNTLVFLFIKVMAFPPFFAKIHQLGLCFLFNFSFARFIVFRPKAATIPAAGEGLSKGRGPGLWEIIKR